MRKIIYTLGFLGIAMTLQAQEGSKCKKCSDHKTQVQKNEEEISALKKLKISGYIQTQMQWGEENSTLRVGEKRTDADPENWNRIGVRRGRLKLAYTERYMSGVFQVDLSEKGIAIKDIYLNAHLPKMGQSSVTTGLFLRPFGYDIEASTSMRETLERAKIFPTLFPEERDLGVKLSLQSSKGSALDFLKLDLAIIAGNGIKRETDSRKDFIGRIVADKKLGENLQGAIGFSYYNGGVYQGSKDVYQVENGEFKLSSSESNKGAFAKREYFGVEGRFSLVSPLGKTQLLGEYLWGVQPGTALSSRSPNSSTLYVGDTYIRNFNGWYATFVQDFGTLPFSAVIRYDSYDPNTNLSGDQIGKANSGVVDLSYNTLGMGLIWYINKSMKLQGYYDIVTNETSKNLAGYQSNLKDNVLTLMVQYKF